MIEETWFTEGVAYQFTMARSLADLVRQQFLTQQRVEALTERIQTVERDIERMQVYIGVRNTVRDIRPHWNSNLAKGIKR